MSTTEQTLRDWSPGGGAGGEQGFIYFIGPKNRTGPIKIGWSRDPDRRLSDMQTANPEELDIWVGVRATLREEWHVHLMLSEHRVRPRSEWYHLAPRVKMLLWALYGWDQDDPPDLDPACLEPFYHLIDRADV